MPSKIAVVVYVKNEFPDFCAWMAWYFAIGVDTIIVYDDHSTDGTWEAAVSASRCLDVRPRRTDLTVQPFTARQRDVYLGAVREFRDEFDWIGFLDADEFLHFRHGVDLPSFMARFPDAGAVAFSWCIYGSNGHLLKPAATTIEAFTRHSLAGFGHNRSVKSFVRPRTVIDRWRDPHTFEVGSAPYVDPQGQPVRWGGPGAIGHDPDWSSAKLMHFIPRSMEHFAERIRRRSDLQGLTNEYWNVFNKNDVEDREPLERLPALHRYLFRINTEIMKEFCRSLPAGQAAARPHMDQGGDARLHIVSTCFDTVLALDETNCLVHLPREMLAVSRCSLVYAMVSGAGVLHLIAPQAEGPLRVPGDSRVSDVLSYRITANAGGRILNLTTPKRWRYLTALPAEASGIGATSADRWEAKDWEQFTTTAAEATGGMLARYPGLRSVTSNPLTAHSILTLAQAGAAPMVCAAGIQLLPDEERALLARTARSMLPSWA